jgi:hypothetical protein
VSSLKVYCGATSDLRANPDQVWAFVSWWFHHCMKGRIELGWMDPRGYGLSFFEEFEIGDERIIERAVAINAVPGQSIYIRASTVAPKVAGHTADEDFVQSPGIWNDIDTREQMARAKSVQTLIRPNGSIITGNIPHQRAQAFFRTTEPISDRLLVKELNVRLHTLYGGDSAVINPTRLMRLPGTVAWPWKVDRVPEMTSFVLPADGRLPSYPLEMLTSQLPQATEVERPAGDVSTFSDLTSRGLLSKIQGGTEWHNNMVKLTAHWIGRGWSNAEIEAAAESFTLPGFTRQQTLREVRKAVEGGRTRWGVPDLDHALSEGPAKPFADEVLDFWDTLQAPAFPIHALPAVIQDFIWSKARIMGADVCALAWATLSACSAAIDGAARMQLKKHDSWAVPPPIWVALIGASSAKKTPVVSAAWSPLERIQASDLRTYAEEIKRYKADEKDEKGSGILPNPPRRLVSHDATMEALQDVLSNQSRGIGVLRDELAGFISGMDKYSGSKGGGADRAFFLQAYNGGSHVVDRVNRGTVVVDNLVMTICGGIQPARLAQFSDLTDDGLWQRFVPIIVGKTEIGLDEPSGDEERAYEAVLARLLTITPSTRASFSEAAHEVRKRVEREIFELEQSEVIGTKFSSFCGKLPGLFGRLCLVLSHIEPSGLGFIVSEKTAEAARVLLMRCVVPHAARVYLTMGASSNAALELSQSIAGLILTQKMERIVASDLTRKIRGCRGNSLSEVQTAVSPLVAGGWLTPEKDNGGNKSWLVNPVVHATFAERAIIEGRRRKAARELITGAEDEGNE